ncbi:S66 family peptidase [Paenibacillus sp. 481]|uniref:S66 family peptidase n=1 Tax=Paenibacillus sp. 481 TaxID=2835869 RepID=UPI001E55DDEE|nr:S66 peptidase family protein [Paenibacillus sp. 481]UHA72687.1 LD-carboxypeptidase [Paenibacillus sp. 481]
MRAEKWRQGDEIRIISPSRTMSIIAAEQRELSKQRLEDLGLRVSFGRHVEETDIFLSSSIVSRITDLHEAFLDPNVKGILTTIGGFNCNQLLRHLDYSIIRANPKRLCGYSDITALSNAIYANTGLITYSGPHFSTFGMLHGLAYTIDYFRKMMFEEDEVTVVSAAEWSDDSWYLNQEDRQFMQNEGPFVIQEGKAEGVIVGGNQCTFNLLHGTAYMPDLTNAILFLEDDYEVSPLNFDRDLQSIIHQPGFAGVQGIVIGRFQKASQMTRELLIEIVTSKQELAGILVIADLDFGHTSPQFTFPIGGRASIEANGREIRLAIRDNVK